jgi:hypothetical protein
MRPYEAVHGERDPDEGRRAVKPEHGGDAEKAEAEAERPHEMDAVDEAQVPLAGFDLAAHDSSGDIGSRG